MKKITVVVPVYNCEKYIESTLESICNQTISNDIKIIAVNDGSKDNSRDIIKEKFNDRVTIIDKENGGVSSARNVAIDMCDTEYIAFVDSDDLIKKDMFEKLYKNLKNNNSDVSICGFRKCTEEMETIEEVIVSKEESITGNEAVKLFLKYKTNGYVWGKLYKTAIFKENNLRFTDQLYEDSIFIYKLYKLCNKISFVKESLYDYIQRPGSLTKINRPEASLDLLKNVEYIHKDIDNEFSEAEKIYMLITLSESYSHYCYNKIYSKKHNTKLMGYGDFLEKIKKYKSKITIPFILFNKDLSLMSKVRYMLFKLNLLYLVYATLFRNKFEEKV